MPSPTHEKLPELYEATARVDLTVLEEAVPADVLKTNVASKEIPVERKETSQSGVGGKEVTRYKQFEFFRELAVIAYRITVLS